MADPLIRFNDNDPIEQGIDAAALSMDDVFAIQHMTGDQDDKMLKLKQVVAIPQLVAAAFNSNSVCTATCLNYPSFQPVLGQPLDIVFNSPYTANGIPSVSYGGLTLPIRAQGVPVGNRFNIFPSGNNRSFHATIKTTATTASAAQTKSNWYIDLDSNIVSVDLSAGVITYADGSTVYNKQSVDRYTYRIVKEIAYASPSGDNERVTYFKINGFKSIVSGNPADMARIVLQTRYLKRLVIDAIAWPALYGNCVKVAYSDLIGFPNFNFGVKFNISDNNFNIYIKMETGTSAFRCVFAIETRTVGAENLSVTELPDGSDYENARYTCDIKSE